MESPPNQPSPGLNSHPPRYTLSIRLPTSSSSNPTLPLPRSLPPARPPAPPLLPRPPPPARPPPPSLPPCRRPRSCSRRRGPMPQPPLLLRRHPSSYLSPAAIPASSFAVATGRRPRRRGSRRASLCHCCPTPQPARPLLSTWGFRLGYRLPPRQGGTPPPSDYMRLGGRGMPPC